MNRNKLGLVNTTGTNKHTEVMIAFTIQTTPHPAWESTWMWNLTPAWEVIHNWEPLGESLFFKSVAHFRSAIIQWMITHPWICEQQELDWMDEEPKQRTPSWVGREQGMDLGGVGGRVNMVKTHFINSPRTK